MAQKQQARHRGLYNLRCRGATLNVGDLVPGQADCLERQAQDPGQMGGQRIPGGGSAYPWYPCVHSAMSNRGQTKVLHRNLLLPLQGRLRQEGEIVGEGVTESEGEEEERAVTPHMARAPKGSPKNTTEPQDGLTPAELKASSIIGLSSSDSSSEEEDSNGQNAYDSLTSHTTASSSTSADIMSAEISNNIPHSITESQFSAVMPYKEDSGQTSSEVFAETLRVDPHTSQQISQSLDTSEASNVNGIPPQSPVPRRSTRSTRGAPPVCFGRVITHGTRVSNMFDNPIYRQTLFVSSIPNILLV